MLIHTPIPLSQTDLLSLSEFLSHKGRAVLERVIRGQIALWVLSSSELSLRAPLNVLADGPQLARAREMDIEAARMKIFLDVFEELSKPEAEFEMVKFDVA